MGKLKELMGKALEIANSSEYNVVIHHSLNDCEEVRWTYLQLGMFLNQEYDRITVVHIYEAPE